MSDDHRNSGSIAGRPHRKRGRPPPAIPYGLLARLCAIGATLTECAGVLGIHPATLKRALRRDLGMTFGEFYALHSAPLRMRLRQAQFDAAHAGDATMQIWLGKLYLGQREPERVQQGDDVAELLRQALRQ